MGARTQGVGGGVNWGGFSSLLNAMTEQGRAVGQGYAAMGEGIGNGLAALGGGLRRNRERKEDAAESAAVRKEAFDYRAGRDAIEDDRAERRFGLDVSQEERMRQQQNMDALKSMLDLKRAESDTKIQALKGMHDLSMQKIQMHASMDNDVPPEVMQEAEKSNAALKALLSQRAGLEQQAQQLGGGQQAQPQGAMPDVGGAPMREQAPEVDVEADIAGRREQMYSDPADEGIEQIVGLGKARVQAVDQEIKRLEAKAESFRPGSDRRRRAEADAEKARIAKTLYETEAVQVAGIAGRIRAERQATAQKAKDEATKAAQDAADAEKSRVAGEAVLLSPAAKGLPDDVLESAVAYAQKTGDEKAAISQALGTVERMKGAEKEGYASPAVKGGESLLAGFLNERNSESGIKKDRTLAVDVRDDALAYATMQTDERSPIMPKLLAEWLARYEGKPEDAARAMVMALPPKLRTDEAVVAEIQDLFGIE